MDAIIYFISIIAIIVVFANIESCYGDCTKRLLSVFATAIVLPIIVCTITIQSATVTKEKFYNIHSYGGVTYEEPANLLVKTTIYPKWSVLSSDTFFTQIPKGT